MTLNRRALLLAGAGSPWLSAYAQGHTPHVRTHAHGHAPMTPMTTINIEERSLAELRADMGAGRVDSQRLVAAYTARIEALDRHGPSPALYPQFFA